MITNSLTTTADAQTIYIYSVLFLLERMTSDVDATVNDLTKLPPHFNHA